MNNKIKGKLTGLSKEAAQLKIEADTAAFLKSRNKSKVDFYDSVERKLKAITARAPARS